MAAIQVIFHELKALYPEVPDEVVNTIMQQNGNDKEKCLQALQSYSDSYLFGGRGPNDQVSRRPQEVHITHEETTIPGPSQHRFISRNRDTGADIHTSISWPSDLTNSVNMEHGRQSPITAPVLPQDFAPFVQQNASQSTRQIPNINCTTYGGTDSSGTASPQSTGSPSEGRRAVRVYHYPSRSPTTPPVSSNISPNPNQQQYVYRIQFGKDSGGMCTVAPQSSSMQNLQSLPTAVNQQGQYSPEAGPQSYAGSTAHVSNQYTHSSQATIFINKNNNNGQISPERPGNRTNNYSAFSRDPRLGVQVPMNATGPTSPVPGYGGVHPIPQGYNKPLSVTIRASGPEGAETKVRYFPSTPERSGPGYQLSGAHSPTRYGETDTGHHMPNYPTMSPASSQSSLSDESSRSDYNHRQRSGSLQDEVEYTQALLAHQNSRMGRLKNDYETELQKLEKLRAQVSQMEKNMLERRSARRNSFPGVDDIGKMRQANRKLQTDIQVMVNEIDMYRNGQTPFSVIDPIGQQNFFNNIPTGQHVHRNSFNANRPSDRTSESPPPVPPRESLSSVPPAPPTQPPAGSGDSEEGEQWSCSACTFLNHPALNKCECCEMPRVTTGS
ncbi:TGF-beta-activated kinase 1 and MAP3K7-binding protein 2-like isoform X2 [Haliotis rufescens]|uniref:TGF-beta-activated kinase 1 and MAP3K7-binding protein 2-like isoform X2 n=1 Tax=Haliotis rufescens TaxID=6454 RepID=UPI00201EAD90|nr:TGF-beta-activated kinase 1 and MAP3K7-binding protein 2-like isoform X2 [Haliotis rufescens]